MSIPREDEKFLKEKAHEVFLSQAARHPNIKSFLKHDEYYHIIKKNFSEKHKDSTNIDQIMIEYFKRLRKTDPFILDQDIGKKEFNSQKGGTPEITYIISRLKGLPIITNRKYVQEAIIKNNSIKNNNIWSDFMDKINRYKFKIIYGYNSIIRGNPSFDIWIKKNVFKEFHIFLKDVFHCSMYLSQDKNSVDRLTQELSIQLQMLDEQWKTFEEALIKNNKEPDKYIKSVKLHFTIKPEGFEVPEADEWIEKYMKDMNIQKSTTLIYIDSDTDI
ncbi:MAG: hypothetical protein OXM55_07425 [Bdellovibrionales bacterium]|nr:hypothetical protein [Bdellovibrionales bacterium]